MRSPSTLRLGSDRTSGWRSSHSRCSSLKYGSTRSTAITRRPLASPRGRPARSRPWCADPAVPDAAEAQPASGRLKSRKKAPPGRHWSSLVAAISSGWAQLEQQQGQLGNDLASDDAGPVPGPVLLAQRLLVQLAGGQPRQRVAEVHAARALQLAPGARWQNAISSASSAGPAVTPGIGCTTALTSSPRSSLGTPNTAASATFGCVISRFSHSCG